jgi:hypothetical protein
MAPAGMNVFFFYIGTPTPILETELELIRRHELQGDSVRVMQCTGRLANCHWNVLHDNLQCAVCRSKYRNAWEVLKPGPNVELKAFPEVDLSGIDLPSGFDSVADIMRFQHDGENLGFGVASGLISVLRDHRFDTRAHHEDVMRELRTAVQVYETLKREFLEFRPDRVYIFNGRIATHLPAYLLCRRMGIDYYCYEVANKDGSYRALRNRRVHEPITREDVEQMRAAWCDAHAQIGESIVRQRRLGKHLVKVPVFTAEQSRGLLPLGFDPGKRNIAIFNGTIDEYAGIEGWSTLYEPDETEGVRRILTSFETDDRFMFYLRVHPNMKDLPESTSQLADIRALAARFGNLRVIGPAEDIDTYALMDACEKAITFGSTMGIEATYWGKTSILAGKSLYENLDCVYRPRTHDELVQLVLSELPPKPPEQTLMYFYWEATDGTPFQYFKETGLRRGRATGTFDGVEIGSDWLPTLAYEVKRFVTGAASALAHPPSALARLRRYAKTFH